MGKSGDKVEASRAERAVSERSANEFNYYITDYLGPEAQLVQQLRTSEGERQSAAGQASGAVETELAGLSKASTAADLKSGATVESGRGIFGQYSVAEIRGTGRADSVTRTQGATNAEDLLGLTKMAAFGQGLANSSTRDLTRQAQTATNMTIVKTRAKLDEKMAQAEAAGTVLGAATFMEGGLADKIKEARKKNALSKRPGGVGIQSEAVDTGGLATVVPGNYGMAAV